MNEEQIRYVFEVVGDEAVKDLNAISKGFDELGRGFKQIGSLSKSFSNTFKSATKSVNVFKKALGTLSGVAVGKFFADATKQAIDYYEVLNLFQVAMKDSVDAGNEFIDTVSEWYGLDPKNLMEYTGLFYEMAYAVNAPDEAARTLSTSLTSLAVDLSSLFNVDIDRVADNLTSGIRGMSRAVLRYGLDLRATTVEAFANSIGITEQYETMNEASREILRYMVAVKQARDATGDFSETIESPANQLRIFKEQMSQLGRAVGTFLVQPLQDVLPVLNGVTMALRIIIETIATLLGFTLEFENTGGFGGEDTADQLNSIGASADSAGKKLKKFLAPFDELNVMQQNQSGSGGGASIETEEINPQLLTLLEQYKYSLDEVRMKAMDTRDALLEFFGFTPTEEGWLYAPDIFEQNLLEKFPQWQETITALFDLDYGAVAANIQTLFSDIGSIISRTIEIILEDFTRLTGITIDDATISDWINNLNTNLENLHTYLTENEEPIAQFLAKLVEGLGAVALVAPVLGILGDGFVTLGIAAMGISGVVNVISGPVGAISPVISTVMGGLSSLVTFLTTNLTGLGIGALLLFVAGFIDGFRDIWTNSEQFRENIGMLFSNIGNMIQSVVSLISTVINQIVELLSPIVNTIGDILQPVYTFIVNLINSIVGVVTGVIEIIDGLLQGDLKLVFKGFMKVLMGLVEAVMNVGAGIVNTILSLIFSAINAVGRLIYGIIKLAVKSVNAFTDLLGLEPMSLPDESLFVFDKIPQIVPPAFDYSFATGGVVTGPTRALIGEAGRAEMVMPLDNSPQMQQFISQIADAVRGNNAQPMEVHVYLDSRAIASGMYDELHNVEFRRGASLIS